MDSQHVFLIMTYEVAPENQQAFLHAFGKLVTKSLQDNGVIWYQMTQSLEIPNTFKLIERWENEESLQKHAESPTMNPYRQEIGPLVISSRKEVLRPA